MTLPLPSNIKLVFLGDNFVGKSMIVEKFVNFSDKKGIPNQENNT